MTRTAANPIRFVTSNAGKLEEARAILPLPVEGVALELEELQTRDLEALVRHKAAQAFRRLGVPLLVEDTSLGFVAWGGLPGPFIKFFLAGSGPAGSRLEGSGLEGLGPAGLVRALEPGGDMAAEAVCGVGYHDGWRVRYFEGRAKGHIVSPRGEGGFGWDAIFLPEESERTFAEMKPEEKHARSMRGQALRRLAEFLEKVS